MSTWQPTASLGALELRARMLRTARDYFAATRALEVETPTLSSAGVSDIHLQSIEARSQSGRLFLHTSPEYAMKRLLAAGCGDIYQIARVYRDGESGRFHNPEFTMIEWYRLGIDHHALMIDVEQLIASLLPAHRSSDRAERVSYRDIVQLHAGVDALDDSTAALIAALTHAGIDVPAGLERNRDACLDLIMSTMVGPKLGRERLTFVHDYPASQAALARVQGRVAARFEAYLDGIELANGFHELIDAREQRKRFDADNQARIDRGQLAMPIDEHFLAALDHGLPACAGVALGFDRLVMCALEAKHIDDVIAFPIRRA
ncbi:MAG TPA: EF-P lysine aminoacylase EpmA [Steroidobacteraceae bacterium]|nr:EF-P lysine aminoacylase EpmA [Steroidobacteraceae bacterium]